MMLNLLSTRENLPLLLLNTILLLINLVGLEVNAWAVIVSIRRKIRVARASEDAIAQLTMRRTVRNEVAFLASQVFIMVLSVYAFFKVLPETPPRAITFYFVSQGGRSLISMVLAFTSITDLFDRKKLATLLDQEHPEAPPTEVG
jgi:hypothetical protein